MPKRSFSEVSGNEEPSLKNDSGNARVADIRRLSELGAKLLPAFQSLCPSKRPAISADAPCALGPNKKESRGEPISQSSALQGRPSRGLEAPWYYLTTPWAIEDIPPKETFPALPWVDDDLRRAAFTHSGFDQSLNYERLEWLGDAYLYLLSSCFIFQTFGGLSAGQCSMIREILVRNDTLGSYFEEYKLAAEAVLPRELKQIISTKKKEAVKLRGDMIEAFVAAVVLSDAEKGVSRAASWLKVLWSKTIEDQLRKEVGRGDGREKLEETGQPRKNALPFKVRLAQAILVPNVEIVYEELGPPTNDKYHKKLPAFNMGAFLNGWGERRKLLGRGTALSKKEASEKAAEMALNNKKMIKVYEDKKRRYVEAKNAEK